MKTYDELSDLDEVVVKVGPRLETGPGGKQITVDPAREQVMTKAGYEAIDRDEEGNPTHIPVEVIGYPEWTAAAAGEASGTTARSFKTIPFATREELAKAKAEAAAKAKAEAEAKAKEKEAKAKEKAEADAKAKAEAEAAAAANAQPSQ
jgi:hypothetical protein